MIIDNYSKLKNRINDYVERYPLPSRVDNINRFKTLRTLENNLPDNEERYNKLRNEIIISNGGFGMKYAIIYCKKVNDTNIIEDLFQQAQIGIIEAVDRFDPNKGFNFTTFAYYYVKKCLIDYIKTNKLIPVPRDMARYIKHISDIHDKLFTENDGESVATEDIQRILLVDKDIDISIDMINDVIKLIELNSCSSEESFIVNNIEGLVEPENNHEMLINMRSIILNEIKDLDFELVDFIKMRFGIEYERPFSISEIKVIRQMDDYVIEQYKNDTRAYLNK